jgi:hypothetical protein
MLQQVDWGVFDEKFSADKNNNFEWFCYLLFCRQFKRQLGIESYFNHPGIETQPIKSGQKFIGFQAKYYSSSPSNYIDELMDSVNKAKENHKERTDLYFYLNKDWGTGKIEICPVGKKRVEECAVKLGVKLKWNTNSFFKSEFVASKNIEIARYFFSNDQSVIDLSIELRERSKSLLSSVKSEIIHREGPVKIDRSEITRSVVSKLESSAILIIHGKGGVGKTAIIKDFWELKENSFRTFLFKASDFRSIKSVNEILNRYGRSSFNDFIEFYEEINEKYIVVDSSEKLSELDDKSVFQEFLHRLIQYGWKIIFTTRSYYLEELKS